MKKLQSLGSMLSKQEMKKIIGGDYGGGCPTGTHTGCHLKASSCGPEDWIPNCNCNDATWYCPNEVCENYCHT